jgi:hypothetical protein
VTYGQFPPSFISSNSSALTNGCNLTATVDTKGLDAEIWFEWDTALDFSNYQSTFATPIQKSKYSYVKKHSESVYGMSEGTDYYFRAVVSNTHGTQVGPIGQCTPKSPPIVSMGDFSGLSWWPDPYEVSFTLNGWVNPLYDYETYAWFEWDFDEDIPTIFNSFITNGGISFSETPRQAVGFGDTNIGINATVTTITPYRILKIYYRICAENRTGSVCSDTYVSER